MQPELIQQIETLKADGVRCDQAYRQLTADDVSFAEFEAVYRARQQPNRLEIMERLDDLGDEATTVACRVAYQKCFPDRLTRAEFLDAWLQAQNPPDNKPPEKPKATKRKSRTPKPKTVSANEPQPQPQTVTPDQT